jgi:CHASE2 domain-containing sensor protein
VLFVLAVFSAFAAAYALKRPNSMLVSFVQGYAGLWLMLAAFSTMRGSRLYEELVKHVGAMMLGLMAVTIAAFYVSDPRPLSFLLAALLVAGFAVTRRYLRSQGR